MTKCPKPSGQTIFSFAEATCFFLFSVGKYGREAYASRFGFQCTLGVFSKWPLFKLLDLLFENEVPGYNRDILIT